MAVGENNKKSNTITTIIVALGSAIIGGVIVWLGQTGTLRLKPIDMSYADLAAVLLASVGVIVAIFGGVLALVAIWGYNQLKKEAVSVAQNEVKGQIENGPLRDYIKGEIETLTKEETSLEKLENLIQQRVDAVAFGRPADDEVLENDSDLG